MIRYLLPALLLTTAAHAQTVSGDSPGQSAVHVLTGREQVVSQPVANQWQCPTPGQTCKIIVLTPEEESILTGKNGVLDTAAQSRALDLGPFVVYVRQKIATAPEGTVTKLPDQAPKEKSYPSVDKK